MAVIQIAATAPSGNISWNNLNEWANLNAYGRDRVSLTEWDTATIPQVAAGSLFEAGGALFQVDTDTSIGGSPSDGYVYILFNPSTLAFTFTNTVPVWDSAKYGYYDTATGYKALSFKILKDGSDYNYKKIDDVERRIINAPERMFEVRYTSNKALTQNYTTSFSALPAFDSILYNLNSCFNNTNRKFTAPSDGLYSISFNSICGLSSATVTNCNFSININDSSGFVVGVLYYSKTGDGSIVPIEHIGKLYDVFSFTKNVYMKEAQTLSLDYSLSGSVTILSDSIYNSSYPDILNINPVFSCMKI